MLTDVREADRLEPSNLEEFYEVEYRRMNWFTHGSALMGTRDLSSDSFLDLSGLAYASCQRLGILAAKITLQALGLFKQGIYSSKWEEVNRNIVLHIQKFLPN